MARIRSIKPEFFLHDGLAELSPLHRLLFIGLWTLADREGRLADKPGRIKVSLLPYDRADINRLLSDLAAHRERFIVRYEIDGEQFIQIPRFSDHQRPHIKETSSIIPPLQESTTQVVREHNLNPAEPEVAAWEGKGREGNGGEYRLEPVGLAPDAPAPRRVRFVPDDFTLTDEMRAYATTCGLDAAAIDTELENFRQFEFNTPKSDWRRCWMRWARTAVDMRARIGAGTRHAGAAETSMQNVRAALVRVGRGEKP